VFKLDPAGTLTTLYSFTGGAAGAYPVAGVVRDSEANLYGTTEAGGIGPTTASGAGVVFKVDASGTYSVLYSFTGGADGASPVAGLVLDPAGNLYGTTEGGGVARRSRGWGVVFELDAAGAETVLYSFTGKVDGEIPSWRA
jgi:uncharacterized repeat protein (TIGR03803 family)